MKSLSYLVTNESNLNEIRRDLEVSFVYWFRGIPTTELRATLAIVKIFQLLLLNLLNTSQAFLNNYSITQFYKPLTDFPLIHNISIIFDRLSKLQSKSIAKVFLLFNFFYLVQASSFSSHRHTELTGVLFVPLFYHLYEFLSFSVVGFLSNSSPVMPFNDSYLVP